MTKDRSGEDFSNSIGLVTSILVRYPEVGSINLDPKTHLMILSFTITESISMETLEPFREKLVACVETFNELENRKPQVIELSTSTFQQVTTLEVRRDVDSISQNEIGLVIALVRQEFNDRLVVDSTDSGFEEDLWFQEELISNMLEHVRSSEPGKKLFAFREEGRVLVFNK